MNINSQDIHDLVHITHTIEERIGSTVEIVNGAVDASNKTVQDFEEIASVAGHLNILIDEVNTKLETFHT